MQQLHLITNDHCVPSDVVATTVQVRLAAGAALACMLEGGPQKAFLGIAERSDADKRPARLVPRTPQQLLT